MVIHAFFKVYVYVCACVHVLRVYAFVYLHSVCRVCAHVCVCLFGACLFKSVEEKLFRISSQIHFALVNRSIEELVVEAPKRLGVGALRGVGNIVGGI